MFIPRNVFSCNITSWRLTLRNLDNVPKLLIFSHHSWLICLFITAVILLLDSSRDVLLWGDCNVGRAGKLTLKLFWFLPHTTALVVLEISDVILFEAFGHLWLLIKVEEEVELPWPREHCVKGKFPPSFFSSMTCSLAWTKASVSS